MKRFSTTLFAALAAISLTTSCSKDSEADEPVVSGLTSEQEAILSNYADDIVVANYRQLATNGKALLEAVKAIQESDAADKTGLIASASVAWKNARITWERTEAYLFGPVDKAGIDPGIDSWPLVLPDLQTSIQEWDPASDSYKSLKGDGGDLKGFHAIEYMLFANGVHKMASISQFDAEYAIDKGSLTQEVFEDKLESYLVAVTEELYRCVLQLEAEWDKDGLSSDKLADFNNFGADITLNTPNGDYAEIYKTPSLESAFYQSFEKSLEESFVGAIGIADEVANVKISDPINAEVQSPGTGLLEVESWFSYNSISDFTNNVRGIKEAYFGELCTDISTFDADTTPHANSIGAYIEQKDKAVHDKVVAALNDAITKVGAMTSPFRDNLSWSASNTAAKDAVAQVQSALEEAQTVLE